MDVAKQNVKVLHTRSHVANACQGQQRKKHNDAQEHYTTWQRGGTAPSKVKFCGVFLAQLCSDAATDEACWPHQPRSHCCWPRELTQCTRWWTRGHCQSMIRRCLCASRQHPSTIQPHISTITQKRSMDGGGVAQRRLSLEFFLGTVFTKRGSYAASEDRTHDLRIMRPTRCQLRYSRLVC